MQTTLLGKRGESLAKDFLEELGYVFVEKNYFYRHGEIDLIYKEKDELVFVEVKYRKNYDFGDPVEAITPKKQALIRRTAEGFVIEKNISNTPCRFDAITIVDVKPKPIITHFKNAF
ncbi:MAG: YraN family protein [Bacteroidota bacterium]